jgi:sialidase-1
MRNYDRTQKSRKISYSEDGGASWGNIESDTNLIEPICQASLLSVCEADGEAPALLFLNPADKNKRQKMTLRISRDNGESWTGSILLHQGPAAYSDLARLANGNLGCFYEAGETSPYQGIVFREVSWQQIELSAL